MARTKYEILTARAADLQAQADEITRQLDGLTATSCGLTCACGEELVTEGDFARHFTIPDERFLNLGDCPHLPHVGPRNWQ